MNLLPIAFVLVLAAGPLLADTATSSTATTTDPAVTAAAGDPLAAVGPFAAADLSLADQLYVSRPVVVFADTPADPDFQRQLTLLERGRADLAERDAVIVIDTDPANPGEWRRRLRPRGFSIVVLDKDQRVVVRKPSPWDAREISRAIDKLPSRRDEVAERYPGR